MIIVVLLLLTVLFVMLAEITDSEICPYMAIMLFIMVILLCIGGAVTVSLHEITALS